MLFKFEEVNIKKKGINLILSLRFFLGQNKAKL